MGSLSLATVDEGERLHDVLTTMVMTEVINTWRPNNESDATTRPLRH